MNRKTETPVAVLAEIHEITQRLETHPHVLKDNVRLSSLYLEDAKPTRSKPYLEYAVKLFTSENAASQTFQVGVMSFLLTYCYCILLLTCSPSFLHSFTPSLHSLLHSFLPHFPLLSSLSSISSLLHFTL
jgi:hypothetical protein